MVKNKFGIHCGAGAALNDERGNLVVVGFTRHGTIYRWRANNKSLLRKLHVKITTKYCDGWVIPIGDDYGEV